MSDPDRLDPATWSAVTARANDVFVSPASAWEIAIKHTLKRLVFPLHRFSETLMQMGWETLPIETHHALEAGTLPLHHKDPFDRMLIAQARLEGLILVTVDQVFARYDVPRFVG